nr:NAD(P)-binding domain-containing protein [Amycolatopsis anabasis]
MNDTNSAASATVLGLGEMGRALARAFLADGRTTTVWNRTAAKADELVARGAVRAATVGEAVAASPVVVVCVLDYPTVHELLDPLAETLSGRVVVNLTTGTPAQARETAEWAARHGITYLDGGIMATPDMIAQPGSLLLYSGSRTAFDEHRALLDLLGESRFHGEDAGLASLHDLALLSAMYSMFAGFLHATALVGTEGVQATEFAPTVVGWLTALAPILPEFAKVIDSGDYASEVQNVNFTKSAIDSIVRVSRDQGIAVDVPGVVQKLLDQQVAEGHGESGSTRIYEGIRHPA